MNRTARIILATGVALAVTLPLFGGVASAAPADATTATTTAETTITVRDGDSLAGVAWRHGVRLSALLRANSLQLTSVIHPGDTLVIPAGATIQTGAAPSARSTVASTSASSNASAATGSSADYVIRPGDALAAIAWRHGVSLGALVRANGIEVTSLILPGQTLQIPPATRPIPTSVVTPAAPPVAPAAARTGVASTPAPVAAPQGSPLQTLLSYATAQVGVPYKFFSAGPDTFDCSGLVVAAFRQIGMNVPHQSRALARLGTAVDWRNESISAGDLVFTSAVGDPDLITHVGIALDSRRWVHAVGFGRTVSIGSLPSTDRIMAVQRIALP
jgi:LysM repeat protein